MKCVVFFIMFAAYFPGFAQEEVKSGVYKYGLSDKKNLKNTLVKGTTRDLGYLEISTITLPPGKSAHKEESHDELEEFIIVKEGNLKITIGNESKVLGAGSMALFLPGDHHSIVNNQEAIAVCYVMQYKAKAPLNMQRGRDAGGSFMIDWNDIPFKENAKGGRRSFFERPTAMFERFELHTTLLNEGLSSHKPHQHRAEENIILISGEASMQIGESHHDAQPGDLIFLASEILHALTNKGKRSCEYFAIQWQ